MFYRCLIIFLLACYAYSSALAESIAVANKSQTTMKQSITVKFDFILDEDINQDDPRVKSLVYCAKSYPQSKIEISYLNPNAHDVADKLGSIFTKLGLIVLKPKQTLDKNIDKNTISRHVMVRINY